jgi:hypothetical protein
VWGGVLWVSESHMVGILSGEWAMAYEFLASRRKWVQRMGEETSRSRTAQRSVCKVKVNLELSGAWGTFVSVSLPNSS